MCYCSINILLQYNIYVLLLLIDSVGLSIPKTLHLFSLQHPIYWDWTHSLHLQEFLDFLTPSSIPRFSGHGCVDRECEQGSKKSIWQECKSNEEVCFLMLPNGEFCSMFFCTIVVPEHFQPTSSATTFFLCFLYLIWPPIYLFFCSKQK